MFYARAGTALYRGRRSTGPDQPARVSLGAVRGARSSGSRASVTVGSRFRPAVPGGAADVSRYRYQRPAGRAEKSDTEAECSSDSGEGGILRGRGAAKLSRSGAQVRILRVIGGY